MTAEAANTDTLTFTVTDGTVMVGEATVTSADAEASNGIIHAIDKVLTPPADEPVDDIPGRGRPVMLQSASVILVLPMTRYQFVSMLANSLLEVD